MTDEQPISCDACDDTGWRQVECRGAERLCGRRRRHLPHTFVRECECRAMNARYQEKQASARRVA